MTAVGCTPRTLSKLPSSWNEEKSYFFLEYYLSSQNWCCYSTKSFSNDYVLAVTDLYTMSHARIDHPTKKGFDFWSMTPINIFRYKLTASGFYEILQYPHPSDDVPGYIVEGAYWSNGFYYQVMSSSDQSVDYLQRVIELNCFIDASTHKRYGYSNDYSTFNDYINAHYPRLS